MALEAEQRVFRQHRGPVPFQISKSASILTAWRREHTILRIIDIDSRAGG